VRLLTLTGPGGVGKTRLGLHVAAGLVDHFADGVTFVALAPLADAAVVVPAVAQALGVRDEGGGSLLERLKAHLRPRQGFLVLDNFEHVLAAGPLVSELLEASAGLKVLVTSRAALHVRGEHELAVPPLTLPDPERHRSAKAVLRYPSAALFVERAAAIRPDLALTDETAPAVAEICGRLDGLPLAIELAAARIRLLTPQAMLLRLDRRLPLLTGGPRDLPARQRTLRDAIGWSHDLLRADERRLFRRLAAFAGGWTLAAAAAVAGDQAESVLAPPSPPVLPPTPDLEILDALASLVDKSLVRPDEPADGESRFFMLATIREYATEQLEANGEGQAIRRRHAAYYLALAEAAEPEFTGPKQGTWLARLDREHANLRAALHWLRQDGDGEWQGLRLSAALWRFWWLRSHFAEGRAHLRTFLALAGTAAPAALRAKALHALGELAFRQGDRLEAHGPLEAGLALCEQAGDRQGTALALTSLGRLALDDGRHGEARAARGGAADRTRAGPSRRPGLGPDLPQLAGHLRARPRASRLAARRGAAAVPRARGPRGDRPAPLLARPPGP
jgi:predicted ATPase